MTIGRRCLWGVGLLLLGCGGAEVQGTVGPGEEPSSLEPLPTNEADTGAMGAPEDAPAPGTLKRADVNAVIAAGPGAALAEVELEPVKQQGEFVGFRIARFTRGTPLLELRVGDVVREINGRRVERPEHYFEVFQELKVASELRFTVLRGGAPMEIRHEIID